MVGHAYCSFTFNAIFLQEKIMYMSCQKKETTLFLGICHCTKQPLEDSDALNGPRIVL